MLASVTVVVLRIVVLLALSLGVAAAPAAATERVHMQLQADAGELARGAVTSITAVVEVEPGWHINSNTPTDPFLIPTVLSLTLPPEVSAEPSTYPPGQRRSFAFAPGKELLVYDGRIGIKTPLRIRTDFIGESVRVAAVLRYQACNDTTCAPPATAQAEAALRVAGSAGAGASAGAIAAGGGGPDLGRWIDRHGLGATLLLVLLLGLGLNLTPCVYPLISVTVAYFGSQAHHHTARVLLLAAVYVLGITVTFSVLGVAAALSGGLFGAAMQQPAVLALIGALFVVLALSNFGVYHFQPPDWLLQRASSAAPGVVGAGMMGLTMGVVAAPCVGPVVAGMLVFVGSAQDVRLGLELFFALGLGMGLPYVALALAAGRIKRLPRSGEWLMWVEHVLGFVLLGFAAHFIAPLLPADWRGLLLPGVVAAAGLYLGFVDTAGRRLPSFRLVRRSVGLAAAAMALWVAWPHEARSAIRWEPLASPAIAAARAAGRPALLDFVADWCIPCHEMERTTYRDAAVRAEADRFAMLKADITVETPPVLDLVDQFAVQGVPTIILLDASGAEVRRLVGYVGAEQLLAAMRDVR